MCVCEAVVSANKKQESISHSAEASLAASSYAFKTHHRHQQHTQHQQQNVMWQRHYHKLATAALPMTIGGTFYCLLLQFQRSLRHNLTPD